MFIQSEFLSLLWMRKLEQNKLLFTRHLQGGEGGLRNGGWGSTGCRSIAAAGFCPFRPFGLQGISLFFSFPSYQSQMSYLPEIRLIYVLRRHSRIYFKLLADSCFRSFSGILFPDGCNNIGRRLKCCMLRFIPTVAINFPFFPSSTIIPDNCNKYVIFQA